jgi:choloylglycine hydrolase
MCTNFKMRRAGDGSVVVGRSMEFPPLLPWSLAVLPAGYQGSGTTPAGEHPSKSWTSTQDVVGICALGNPQFIDDGMNSAGLSAHGLYMPNGYCTYGDFLGDGSDLGEMDIIAFLLGTCATIAEVKAAAQAVNVWGADPGIGFVPPLHVLVHSADESLAIEFHPDGLHLVDNPTGVGTNSPYLDWHLTNLNNYVGLAPTVPPAVEMLGEHLAQFGQGGGLRGLPGDYTAPARFVRAAALVALSPEPADGTAAELQTMHVLNSFDIPRGAIREEGPKGGDVAEVTDWITISNLTQGRYTYRTVDDPRLYSIELAAVDFAAGPRSVPFTKNPPFIADAP